MLLSSKFPPCGNPNKLPFPFHLFFSFHLIFCKSSEMLLGESATKKDADFSFEGEGSLTLVFGQTCFPFRE